MTAVLQPLAFTPPSVDSGQLTPEEKVFRAFHKHSVRPWTPASVAEFKNRKLARLNTLGRVEIMRQNACTRAVGLGGSIISFAISIILISFIASARIEHAALPAWCNDVTVAIFFAFAAIFFYYSRQLHTWINLEWKTMDLGDYIASGHAVPAWIVEMTGKLSHELPEAEFRVHFVGLDPLIECAFVDTSHYIAQFDEIGFHPVQQELAAE